jgi:hypothetical protein
MCFAGEESEVFRPGCVLEFLDVCIIDTQTKLIEFGLDLLDDFILEDAALAEQFFHGHVGHDATRFAFNDAFDDFLDMIATRGDSDCTFGRSGWRATVGFAGQEDSVFLEGVLAVFGANGEDGWEAELELLDGHGLDAHAEVERRDADFGNFLEGVYEGLLSLANVAGVCSV